MSLRRRNLACFVRREDLEGPSPSGGEESPTNPPSHARHEDPGFANSPLPAAMLAVANDDSPQSRQALYQSVLDTWFIVPTREAAPEKPGFHDTPTNIADSFSLEHDSEGQLVVVAFTDEEALRNWSKSIPWIALQGTAFFQAVANTPAEEIVINPYEPANPVSKMIRPGGRMKRWEFESLAIGHLPRHNSSRQEAESQSVLVAMPKQMPTAEMFNAISEAARAFPEITGMYFGQAIYPDGEPHWIVAVESAAGALAKEVKHALTALMETARRVFPRTVTTDLLPASAALGQSIKALGKKFHSAPIDVTKRDAQ
jgi:hypothetical protein